MVDYREILRLQSLFINSYSCVSDRQAKVSGIPCSIFILTL